MYSPVILLCIHVDIYTVCNLDTCTNVHTGSMSISVHVHGASYTCTDTEFMFFSCYADYQDSLHKHLQAQRDGYKGSGSETQAGGEFGK